MDGGLFLNSTPGSLPGAGEGPEAWAHPSLPRLGCVMSQAGVTVTAELVALSLECCRSFILFTKIPLFWSIQ